MASLYIATANSPPNPRRVLVYLHERNLMNQVKLKYVDLGKREHKTNEFLRKNPIGRIPILELPDGSTISESVSICRYFDAVYPDSASFFGKTPLEKALVDQWIRIMDTQYSLHLIKAWLNSPTLKKMFRQEYNKNNEALYREGIEGLDSFHKTFDEALAKTPFIAGSAFTMADIVFYVTLDFAFTLVGVKKPSHYTHLTTWFEKISKRPSIKASLFEMPKTKL